MKSKLSVNINKFATLRNSRGGNLPNVLQAAIDCERFGAQGITVHPRPDERHIRYSDVLEIRPAITTEFNIEGNPIDSFMELVLKVQPTQVTLVPDAHEVLTSNAGWNTKENLSFLKNICNILRSNSIRSSIFVDPDVEMVKYAAQAGCDRVELYTEDYARTFYESPEKAIEPYIAAAEEADRVGLGLNAGHDLNLDNLSYFSKHIPNLAEVSIGHALVCDALYLGLENTIRLYRRAIQ